MDQHTSLRRNGLVFALWALGALGAVLLFRDTLGSHLANRDFVAVWVAGKLALSGQAVRAYDHANLLAVAHQMVGTTPLIAYPYPPHALFLAIPLSLLPLPVAYWGWQAFSAAFFYIAARPYAPTNFPKILAILTPAALISVGFGQVGLFFGALWLFAFNGSALAAGALTFKPHLGFLVACEAARRKEVLRVVAVAIAMVGLSAALFGIDAWRAWLTEAVVHQVGDLAGRDYTNWYNKMTTPFLGFGIVGWFFFAAAAIGLLFMRFDVFTAATASFLIAPYGFHYDMSVVCLGFGLLLFSKRATMAPWQTFIVALGFLVPLIVGLGTWFAPPLLLAGLYVQVKHPLQFHDLGSASLTREDASGAE